MASVLVVGVGSVGASAQTTQPAGSAHAARLKEAAKRPLLRETYRSVAGKPLTDDEKAEIARSKTLMARAARLREQGDFSSAARQSREALNLRQRVLGGGHHLSITAAVAAGTLAQYAAKSDAVKKELVEADKQLAAAEEAHERGDDASSETAAKRSVAIRERILGKDHPEVGRALRRLGDTQTSLLELDDAEASLTRALTIAEATYGKSHPQTALVLDRLGWLKLHLAGRGGFSREAVDETAALYRRAVSIFTSTVGETAEAAEAMDNLGTVLLYARETEKALMNKLRSLVIREALLGPDHKDTAVSLSNIGWLYERMNMPEEALPLKRRGLAILFKAVGPEHPYTLSQALALAQAYQRRGMVKEAIESLEQSISWGEKGPSRITAEAVSLTSGLGAAYLAVGRQEDADRMLKRALDLAVSLHAAGRVEAATDEMVRLGATYQRRRMFEPAIQAYEQAMSWDRKRSQSWDQGVVRRAVQLGGFYINVGRFQDAKRVLAEAVRQSEALHGEGALETFVSVLALSLAHEKSGELDAAERLCEKALRISEMKLPAGSRPSGHAMAAMGRIQTLQKRFDLAKFSLEEAKAILEKFQEAEPLVVIGVWQDTAALHLAAGRTAEGVRLLRDALQRCREVAKRSATPHVEALLAKSIKLLLDATEGGGSAAKDERAALVAELKALLEKLRSGRGLDADGKRWLEELSAD